MTLDIDYLLEVAWRDTGSYKYLFDPNDNLTGDAIAVESLHGRDFDSAVGRWTPGQLSALLRNDDGKYSPNNAGSPLSGYLKTGRPMILSGGLRESSLAAKFVAADTRYLMHADHATLSVGDIYWDMVVWVKLPNPAATNYIVSKYTNAGDFEYYLYTVGSQFVFVARNLADTANFTVTAITFGAIPADTWCMVYLGHHPAVNKIFISINAGEYDFSDIVVGGVRDATSDFRVGSLDGAPGNYLDGIVGPMAIWKPTDTNLTAAQLTWLYNEGYGRDFSELGVDGTDGQYLLYDAAGNATLGPWWQMDEVTGTRVSHWADCSLTEPGGPVEDTFELAADTDDGYLDKTLGGTYADTRSSAAGVNNIAAFYVGQYLSGGIYSIRRSYLRHDTSAIDDGDDVLTAKLRLYLLADWSDTDFTIQVRAFTWGVDLEAADWRAAPSGDTLVGSISTAQLPAPNNWVEIDIDPGAIVVDGYTEFYLISSRDDDDPGTEPTGQEMVGFEARKHADDHAAQLVVTHEAAGAGPISSEAGLETKVYRPLWAGLIETITPSVSTVGGLRTATLKGSGLLSSLAAAKKLELPIRSDFTGLWLSWILQAFCGTFYSPSGQWDTGQTETAPFYSMDEADGLELCRQIEDCEPGLLYECLTECATLRRYVKQYISLWGYADRWRRLTSERSLVSQATFSDAPGGGLSIEGIEQLDPLNGIYNSAQITVFAPATVGGLAVLWTHAQAGSIRLAPGQLLRLVAKYPTDASGGAAAAYVDPWTTPVEGTDIICTGGYYQYLDLLNVVKSATEMAFTIRNTSSNRYIYLTLVQARGIPKTKECETLIVAEDATSIAAYGLRAYPLPPKWLANIEDAQNFCDYIISRYKDSHNRLRLTFTASRDDAHMSQALTGLIGDRVTIDADGASGLGINEDFYIESIDHAVDMGKTRHVTTYELVSCSGEGAYAVLANPAVGWAGSPLDYDPAHPACPTSRLEY